MTSCVAHVGLTDHQTFKESPLLSEANLIVRSQHLGAVMLEEGNGAWCGVQAVPLHGARVRGVGVGAVPVHAFLQMVAQRRDQEASFASNDELLGHLRKTGALKS